MVSRDFAVVYVYCTFNRLINNTQHAKGCLRRLENYGYS